MVRTFEFYLNVSELVIGLHNLAALNSSYGRLHVYGINELDTDGYALGMALAPKTIKMITYKRLYAKIYDFDNLFLAYQKARKGKTRRDYVIEFEKNLERNLLDLQFELKSQTYAPRSLKTFILRDPKTRKTSKIFDF